jgi:uncharacterized protein YdeI (YjbR/CyaY-like superfamily)
LRNNKYITPEEEKKLSREVHPLPDFIDDALKEEGLDHLYMKRPAYQKNDYIGWIGRAKTEKTLIKRLDQMLEELKDGDKYMKMRHGPRSS